MKNYPFPSDWVARYRSWRPSNLDTQKKQFRDLVAYPAFRRNLPGFSGNGYVATLADLAAIDAGAEPTEQEIFTISSLEKHVYRFPNVLDLEIADDATSLTSLTTNNRLLLRAYRNFGGGNPDTPFGVRLWWPCITDWRWIDFVNGTRDAVALERAFVTGEVPPYPWR